MKQSNGFMGAAANSGDTSKTPKQNKLPPKQPVAPTPQPHG